MRKSIFIGALALPLFGASCFNIQETVPNKIAEQATETILEGATGNTDIEIDGDEVSIVGEDGQTLNIGTKELPQNFPSQVPVYPGATVQSSFESSTDTEAVWTVTFTSTDGVEAVNDFFEAALATDGWDIAYSYSLDQSYGYTAKNGNLSATVTVSADDQKGTSIFISVSKETDETEE